MIAALLPLALFLTADAGLVADDDPATIVGGDEVVTCGWPSVVRLNREDGTPICSGTLVHPYIVSTAAHCLFTQSPIAEVRFGEDESNFVPLAQVEYCEANPEYIDGPNGLDFDNRDFAFCKLATPVENVPVIPIAYGCEIDEVVPGATLAAAGFGMTSWDSEDHGIKRWATGQMFAFDADGEIRFEPITCSGDSGTGLFTQLDDGSLRQVGISSHSYFCTQYSAATAAWQLVPFVHEVTGINIAPCHTLDGDWAPTGWCGGFPLEPHVGGAGDYSEGCPTGALSGYSAACGPAVDAVEDAEPPTVAIAEPDAATEIELDDNEGALVSVTAVADDAAGWGVAEVELSIESEGIVTTHVRATPPYTWAMQLPKGAYFARATALDFAGHTAESSWVEFGVGVPAPPPRSDDAGTSTGTDAESSDDGDVGTSGTVGGGETDDDSGSGTSAAAEPAQAGEDPSCACGQNRRGHGFWLLVLFAVWRPRPRSRRPPPP